MTTLSVLREESVLTGGACGLCNGGVVWVRARGKVASAELTTVDGGNNAWLVHAGCAEE